MNGMEAVKKKPKSILVNRNPNSDYLRQSSSGGHSNSGYVVRSGYDELDPPTPKTADNYVVASDGLSGVQWRDPDLSEVIGFLSNANSVIRANAAAYLQHLCYRDDPVKTKTRQLGGIVPLVQMLANDKPEIQRNACGALRNLSYGRQNDENKRAIKQAGGVSVIARLLRKSGSNDEMADLLTGVIWNLSSCEDLKRPILEEALSSLVNVIILPHSGWDANGGAGSETIWSNAFRNASGALRFRTTLKSYIRLKEDIKKVFNKNRFFDGFFVRNVSSAGGAGRQRLRESVGLVDSLLYVVKRAIASGEIDSKSVENCVCVLRNLSFRAQETVDPDYERHVLVASVDAKQSRVTSGLGCFRKVQNDSHNLKNHIVSAPPRQQRGMELLWQPEVVQPYLNLLSNCSNPETLEAAAGALQNLSACYWQPSLDLRSAVRKEKGLPILVELLRMEVDAVVCAVATALRNLAIDTKNKELIGKYAMRDLVQKLPQNQRNEASDDTIAAVLATLNEVVRRNPEFARSLLEAGGVERLCGLSRQRQRHNSRVIKFASQVLFSMWQHVELREAYKKAGWREQDFVSRTIAARNIRPNSPTNLNSTLNRPMASQGRTRYEDRTLSRRTQEVQQGVENMGLYQTSQFHQQPTNTTHHPENSY